MANTLQALLDLPQAEKVERGLQHTPREVEQQPETWKATYRHCRSLQPALSDALRRAGVGSGRGSPVVYLVGAGTSDYVGRALAPLLRERWGCEAWPIPSTTLLTDFEQYHRHGQPYLWISFSRSGDSPEGVALLASVLERHPEIQHLVITCNRHGHMAELGSLHEARALALILDDAVNDRGLAMTSSFTNMVVAGQCIANVHAMPEYGDLLAQMVDAGTEFLPAAAEVAARIAAQDCTRACFVGSSALRAAAEESALKLAELSAGKVATMAESPLGLRHGPLSSIDGKTLFVAFVSSDPRLRGYEIDLLEEVSRKRLGRVRAVVTAGSSKDVSALADHCLTLNDMDRIPDFYRPTLDVMFGQLLGLFTSLKHGLKPDHPSPNGAITRVVAPIRLYS